MPNIYMKGLEPIVTETSTVMILGTFPGPKSLESKEYYAHPLNEFWSIMAEICGFNRGLEYRDRILRLNEKGIAVWDVLYSCSRIGALDSKIQDPTGNDFQSFFENYSKIRRVFFNGKKAEKLYSRHVIDHVKSIDVQYQYLPSTSPANARITKERKLEDWRKAVEFN